jgi:hypothetical protein
VPGDTCVGDSLLFETATVEGDALVFATTGVQSAGAAAPTKFNARRLLRRLSADALLVEGSINQGGQSRQVGTIYKKSSDVLTATVRAVRANSGGHHRGPVDRRHVVNGRRRESAAGDDDRGAMDAAGRRRDARHGARRPQHGHAQLRIPLHRRTQRRAGLHGDAERAISPNRLRADVGDRDERDVRESRARLSEEDPVFADARWFACDRGQRRAGSRTITVTLKKQ